MSRSSEQRDDRGQLDLRFGAEDALGLQGLKSFDPMRSRLLWRAAIEGWVRIVFQRELKRSRSVLARQFRCKHEAEVNARP